MGNEFRKSILCSCFTLVLSNALAQVPSQHLIPSKALGLANHSDSSEAVNALVLIGSYCGWKSSSFRIVESAEFGKETPAPREIFNFRDPIGGQIPGKAKGCSPAMSRAVHQTLDLVLSIYLKYFGYRHAIMVEYGVEHTTITTVTPDPDSDKLKFSTVKIDAVTMQERYENEVNHLKSTLLWVTKNWTKTTGSLNIYFNLHSSPTHLFINQRPFLIPDIWRSLIEQHQEVERSHWYFDTCWAGRVQNSVDEETDEGFQLLSELSSTWTVGVSAMWLEENIWLFSDTEALSPYAMGFRSAVQKLSNEASLSELFFAIGSNMQRILALNGHPGAHRAGFSIFDLNFAKSKVYLIPPGPK